MQNDVSDALSAYAKGFQSGVAPDPSLWIDLWSDEFMRIPRGNGAEPGKYKTSRTPYAKEPMRCLSPDHPCKRVVAVVASQLFKTQVGINWLSASIHQAPGNMLVLLPSLGLAKRVSGRFAKTIDNIPVLREKVAQQRSRDARNTIDTKEFEGGTLYITTAGSAKNLAEIPARYVYGDEIDRWEVSVDQEGDPVELAETRTSTFGRNAKIYYTSSPTTEGSSRIQNLYDASDQRNYYVPCPHCNTMQLLEFKQLSFDKKFSKAQYLCAAEGCGAFIEESSKGQMLKDGQWVAHADGDGETVGFMLSSLYAPAGWVSWVDLGKQHAKAKKALEAGDTEPMQVFYNTRLALCWDDAQERKAPSALQQRAEGYKLRTIPSGVLMLTAAVDVQHNRLEIKVIGWGAWLERWVIDYKVIIGDPAARETWEELDQYLMEPIQVGDGSSLELLAVAIDSGGHHTHEVYQFCRDRKHRHVLAVKGANKPGRPVLSGKPSKMDIKWDGVIDKRGADLWMIGTDTAKDWLYNRWAIAAGPEGIHFSKDLDSEFYAQLVAERKVTRYIKGHKRTDWTKAKGARNEALDLSVYNLAMAHYLGLHRFKEQDWIQWKEKVKSLPKNPPKIKEQDYTSAKEPLPIQQKVEHWIPKGAGYQPPRR